MERIRISQKAAGTFFLVIICLPMLSMVLAGAITFNNKDDSQTVAGRDGGDRQGSQTATQPAPAIDAGDGASALTTELASTVRSFSVDPDSHGTGNLTTIPGVGEKVGSGRTYRYMIEVEDGLPIDGVIFAREVEATLSDARGWRRGGISLQRVDAEPAAFRVTLASRNKTDELCAPLDTGGIYSCYMNGRSVLNFGRWIRGADAFGGDLIHYRQYVVNHEVGHALGHGHRKCPGEGSAPVMMQQTVGVDSCAANGWPLDKEL